MSSDGSMATPVNGVPHTSLGAQFAEGMSAATTNYVDPTLLSVNGVTLEDSNGSSVSEDEVYSPYITNAIFGRHFFLYNGTRFMNN